MLALKEAGACGFTDDGIPLLNAEFCYQAMKNAAKLNVPISLHEEDPAFIRNNGINHGKVSDALGIYGSPSIAEEALVARDCLLALRSGADVVIQHISSGVSIDLIRTYKKLGAKLHAEATPHHFSLTEDAVLEHGTLAKMNPPLRTENDRQQIIAGLADGTIDLIATDHAPHSTEEKSKPITEAPKRHYRSRDLPCTRYHQPCKARISDPDTTSGKNDSEPGKAIPSALRNNSGRCRCRLCYI